MTIGKKYALLHVDVIDGTGADIMKNMAIEIDNGYISHIESADGYNIPADIHVMDLCGKTVMPGMIDAHVHLCGVHDFCQDTTTNNIIYSALKSVPQAQAMLKRGFTSVRDLSRTGLYLKRVIHQGIIKGPRIVSCGVGISPTGGALDIAAYPIEIDSLIKTHSNFGVVVDGIDEIKKAIRANLREGADQIKFFANGSDGSPVDKPIVKQFTLEEMKVIVEEARRVPGTKVLAHLQENKTAWECMEADVDTFEHLGYLDQEFCNEMIKRNKYLVPTVALETTFEEKFKDEGTELLTSDNGPFYQRDLFNPVDPIEYKKKTVGMFKMAHKAGVKIALGSDSIDEVLTPYGEYSITELCTFVELGMTPLEAIRSACQIGAEVLGLEQVIGTIQSGKLADIIILDGNPVEDITIMKNPEIIEYVIQSGIITVDHQKIII